MQKPREKLRKSAGDGRMMPIVRNILFTKPIKQNKLANTYTRIYLHLVFAVKNRNSLIPAYHQPRLFRYIGGTISTLGHKPLEVGGIDNHVHILVGLNVKQSVADFVRDIKSATARFINDSRIIPYRFEWQSGYGCFSYS